jgi:hypothetical protein
VWKEAVMTMPKVRMPSGSWKTTAAGVAGIVGLLMMAFQAQFDEDPKTVAEWWMIVPVVISQIGLLFARDNDKSSEQVGVKP